MTHKYTDVLIVGSGMIGGALALGLAQTGFSVTIIEQVEPFTFDPKSQPDIRISAINISSVNFLRKLKVWEKVIAMRAHPYHQVETWELDWTHVIFDAAEFNLPLLGYMVENNILRLALWQTIKDQPKIELHAPTSLISLYRENKQQFVILNDGKILKTKLIIGADGANSQVRKMAGIGIYSYQYHQSCILITVDCENQPGVNAWQHFTINGPRAFLPLFDNWASLIWYDLPIRILKLKNMKMSQLQHEIIDHFPTRLGKIRPIAANIFPIIGSHALNYVHDGLALVGDAAHTIHPLAGQGVNLGYRDVVTLINVLTNAYYNNEIWESKKVLKRYQTKRMLDNFVMQLSMDFFHNCFSNNSEFIKILRNICLTTIEHSNILKQKILKYALGI